MKRNEFDELIKDAIYKYIENKPERDTVDILSHFNLGQEKVFSALADLKEENRVKTVFIGLKSCYVISR